MERNPIQPGGVTDQLSVPSFTRQPLPEHLLRVGPEPACWPVCSFPVGTLAMRSERKVAPMNRPLAGSPHLPGLVSSSPYLGSLLQKVSLPASEKEEETWETGKEFRQGIHTKVKGYCQPEMGQSEHQEEAQLCWVGSYIGEESPELPAKGPGCRGAFHSLC